METRRAPSGAGTCVRPPPSAWGGQTRRLIPGTGGRGQGRAFAGAAPLCPAPPPRPLAARSSIPCAPSSCLGPRYQSAPLSSAPRTPSSTASVLTPTPHTPPPAPPGPQAPSFLTPSPVPLSLRFPGVCPHGLLTAGRRGEDGAPGRQGARASQAQSSTGPRRPPSRRERGAGTPLPASRAAAQVPPGPAGGLATCNPTAPASGPPGPRRTGPLGLAPSCFPRFVCPRVSSRPPANPRL